MAIDKTIMQRTPLMRPEWMKNLRRMGKDAFTPRWNHRCGDRLEREDLDFVRQYAHDLVHSRKNYTNSIRIFMEDYLNYIKENTLWYRHRIGDRGWQDRKDIPVTLRRHLASHLEEMIPLDADLQGLVVNPSSGTSGEALYNPNHPRSVGCYDPLIQYALGRHGVIRDYDHRQVAAVQLCYQKNTITYYTVHSYLSGAGFVKINLHPDEWRAADYPNKYLHSLQPVFLSGDPVAFMYAMESGINYRPQALLSTALTLQPEVRRSLEQHFQCPVVDMYSLNESGPVLYSCPAHPGRWHVLPHDVYVELLDEHDQAVEPGRRGFITISGGRNPYLPMVRYKTEDTALHLAEACDCGETTPSFEDLEGRQTVLFRHSRGGIVNPVDVSRILKDYPIVIFQFVQYNNTGFRLRFFGPLVTATMAETMRKRLLELTGSEAVEINRLREYPQKKWMTFIRED